MTAVNPSMVKAMGIGFCQADTGIGGCFHSCNVTLSDGRKGYGGLYGGAINTLIQSVANEKISYAKGDKSHFKKLSPEDPESILTGLFSLVKDLSCAEV